MKNNIPSVLVTGANGQLGSELKLVAARYPSFHFIFVTRNELAIDDHDAVQKYFAGHDISYCINCAAYTAVDKAESDTANAFLINAEAAGNLAKACKEHQVQFIHISTDYVFDGNSTRPYKETDLTNPLGVYGASKRKGEELALQNDPSAIIIRTSWLYSSFGNNFVKTMLRLMKERETLPAGRQGINVVNDQFGCPTYAADLADAIMKIISSGIKKPGIYHFSNAGITTWYGFATAIKELSNSNCKVNPVTTAGYPTPTKRPGYTAMDTSKIRETFSIAIPQWKESLSNCIGLLK